MDEVAEGHVSADIRVDMLEQLLAAGADVTVRKTDGAYLAGLTPAWLSLAEGTIAELAEAVRRRQADAHAGMFDEPHATNGSSLLEQISQTLWRAPRVRRAMASVIAAGATIPPTLLHSSLERCYPGAVDAMLDVQSEAAAVSTPAQQKPYIEGALHLAEANGSALQHHLAVQGRNAALTLKVLIMRGWQLTDEQHSRAMRQVLRYLVPADAKGALRMAVRAVHATARAQLLPPELSARLCTEAAMQFVVRE